jgi:methionine-S-sulfoxide reductase
MGGKIPHPTYEEVCSGTTGHWEVVQVVYDPSQISYHSLLATFWDIVDHPCSPGTSDDDKSQFHPAIFFHSADQERTVRASVERRKSAGEHPLSEEVHISPASVFYEADEHHQQFYEKCGKGYAAQTYYYE